MKRFLVSVAIVAALACGCSSGPGRAAPNGPGGAGGHGSTSLPHVRLAAALQSTSSCDDLLGWIKAQARPHVGPYGFDGGVAMAVDGVTARSAAGFAKEDAASGGPATSTAPAAPLPATSGATDEAAQTVTGTNNQESAVDEIDRFKTDGRRVVMADASGRLMAVDITGPTPRKLGQVDLRMFGTQLFLDGDEVIAVGTPSPMDGGDLAGEQVAIARIALGGGAPTVTSRATVDGHLVSGRSSDGSIRLVVTTAAAQRLGFVSPTGGDAASVQTAIDTNRQKLADSTLDDWLPRWTSPTGSAGPLVDCGSMFHPATWSGASTVSVLTLSDDLADLHPVGVFGGGDTIYASTTGLYVATQVQPATLNDHGMPIEQDTLPAEHASIHRFDTSVAGATTYQGSGEVPGHVLNQFAMSEDHGDLRVATTVDGCCGRVVPMPMPADCPNCGATASSSGDPAGGDASVSAPASDATAPANRSLLTVLRLEGGQLRQVGQLDGLGPNEQIQSVRFVGDRAYVVTFRRMDPLFVIDLADPTHPRLLGELHEPGFSAYLHPIGADRMLGVGSSGTDAGMLTGAKVALYDTSDPTHPRVVATIPIQDGASSAGDDSHAFTWDAAHHLAFIPLTLEAGFDAQGVYQPVQGVAVYRVTDDAITWVGWIDHSKHASAAGGWSAPPCPPNAVCARPAIAVAPSPVDRTAVVGDRIFAGSAAGLSQVALDGFAETGWVGWS